LPKQSLVGNLPLFAATGKGQGSWDPTEKKYYPFIDDIAPLGVEEVVIDIGWWSSYGKPKPGHIVTDAVDWPSGMAAAALRVTMWSRTVPLPARFQ